MMLRMRREVVVMAAVAALKIQGKGTKEAKGIEVYKIARVVVVMRDM